jgi:Ca2+/Na+ antiporter
MEKIKEFALLPNEKVLKVVRHHPIIIAPHLVISFLILLLDFFLMYYLFVQGTLGAILFCLVIAVVAFYIYRLFFLYKKNRFVITNLRIIDFEQDSFFEKYLTQYDYGKICEAQAKVKGLFPTLFKYGNLRLALDRDAGPYEIYKIPHPLALQEMISQFINKKPSENAPAAVSEAVPLVLAEMKMLKTSDKQKLLEELQKELREKP